MAPLGVGFGFAELVDDLGDDLFEHWPAAAAMRAGAAAAGDLLDRMGAGRHLLTDRPVVDPAAAAHVHRPRTYALQAVGGPPATTAVISSVQSGVGDVGCSSQVAPA